MAGTSNQPRRLSQTSIVDSNDSNTSSEKSSPDVSRSQSKVREDAEWLERPERTVSVDSRFASHHRRDGHSPGRSPGARLPNSRTVEIETPRGPVRRDTMQSLAALAGRDDCQSYDNEPKWPTDWRAYTCLFGGFLLMFNSWGTYDKISYKSMHVLTTVFNRVGEYLRHICIILYAESASRTRYPPLEPGRFDAIFRGTGTLGGCRSIPRCRTQPALDHHWYNLRHTGIIPPLRRQRQWRVRPGQLWLDLVDTRIPDWARHGVLLRQFFTRYDPCLTAYCSIKTNVLMTSSL